MNKTDGLFDKTWKKPCKMKVIPKRDRIKVYKRALEIVENEKKGHDSGLCILLRDLYYNYDLAWVHQRYELTPERFPEFGKFYNFNYQGEDEIKFYNLYLKNDNLWRRVVLRLILEELKANEEI